ncbi:spore germination protein [Paenibacillus sp. UNC451MF]|uniref:spore germination protein n=1 Tax=Paenibacillus sp. UNC451MF TaxID=1449063 RepID=UPI00068CDA70|nr:spore germination protein [Paenibacillus sp. UNC451MF]
MDWSEEKLRELFFRCDDVNILLSKEQNILRVFCEGLCSNVMLKELVMHGEEGGKHKTEHKQSKEQLGDGLLLQRFADNPTEQDIMDQVFRGNLVVFELDKGDLYHVETSNRPERSPEESSTELTVYGPRDSFVEQVTTNVALIRKRIRSNTLSCENFTIGSRSRTEVSLLYLNDVLNESIAEDIRSKLKGLNVDAVFNMEELKNLLIKPGLGFFPLVNITTRTDMVVNSLMRGRFVILMDGNPTAMVAPVNISYMMAVAEDAHTPILLVYIERMMRRMGLVMTVLLPGFWVALTAYHQDQIPFPLLATVAISTAGTPLSGPMEILLMLLLFQFFLEAGSRLPSALGPSVSVVGGLIIGDAIIKAGLTSPATLVVAAVSATAQFTIVNGLFGLSVGVIRLYIFFLSSFFGLFGFFTAAFSVLIYLSNLKSFGVPYLAPYAPFNWKDLRYVLFHFPRGKRQKPPRLLHTQGNPPKRSGGE